MEVKIKLKEPIDEGKIAEITVKEPTFRQLAKHGLPFDKEKGINFEAAGGLLEACTGIQRPYIDMLCMRDALAVAGALGDFITADEETVKN